MAVTQRRTVELRPWNAFSEPALPEGGWFVNFVIAHAGGGGLVTAEARFQETNESLSSRLWSMEQISMTQLGALGSPTIEIRTTNLETFQRQGVGNTGFTVRMVANPGTGRSLEGSHLTFLPWFLGAPRIENIAAGFEVLDADGGVGERTSMLISGYYWGPAARNAPGGPQRPVTGLFGR